MHSLLTQQWRISSNGKGWSKDHPFAVSHTKFWQRHDPQELARSDPAPRDAR
ncbi:MAG: hypothetical protein ACXWQ5_07390 [Ktedonobacterales bacterium]